MIPRTLFAPPDAFAEHGMDSLYQVIDSVMPMSGAQKHDLPMACKELSAMLTAERDAPGRHYWASPRLTSAYLRYFLPWNLVRLSSLLPGLDLGDIPKAPLILDLGCGPMTLPLALWLSRPDLRSRPVTMVASDTAPHILEVGREIFERLRTSLDPKSPWTVRSMRASVHQAMRQIHAKPKTVWMISMGNVLNEMEGRRLRSGHQAAERMRMLLEDASFLLAENGMLLSVEPGTRQGGRLVSQLRKHALGGMEDDDADEKLPSTPLRKGMSAMDAPEDHGEDNDDAFTLPPLFRPLAPCPHAGPCPMLGKRAAAWCHVKAPVGHVPKTLREISTRAGLNKESVSLSFLLLEKLGDHDSLPMPSRERTISARILSDAFIIQDHPGRARYACTERGLALVPTSAHLPMGTLCEGFATSARDEKSRAFILELADRHCKSFPHAEGREEKRPAPAVANAGSKRSPALLQKGYCRERAGCPHPKTAGKERGRPNFRQNGGTRGTRIPESRKKNTASS